MYICLLTSSAHPGEEPIIVTSAQGLLINAIVQKSKDQVFGGRPHVIYKVLDNFFETLMKLDVKFVFFFHVDCQKTAMRTAMFDLTSQKTLKCVPTILRKIFKRRPVF